MFAAICSDLSQNKLDDPWLRSEQARIQGEGGDAHNLDLNRSCVAMVDQNIALWSPGNRHDSRWHCQEGLGRRVQPLITNLLSIDLPRNPLIGEISNIYSG